jgi:hypothetical protein
MINHGTFIALIAMLMKNALSVLLETVESWMVVTVQNLNLKLMCCCSLEVEFQDTANFLCID